MSSLIISAGLIWMLYHYETKRTAKNVAPPASPEQGIVPVMPGEVPKLPLAEMEQAVEAPSVSTPGRVQVFLPDGTVTETENGLVDLMGGR